MKDKLIKLKNNKGFTMVDIAVSVTVIIIFIGIITTVFYNYYLSNTAKNRNAMATCAVIDIIEDIKTMNYDEIDQASIEQRVQTLVQDGTIPSGYTPLVEIQKYNETEGNTDKKDRIKILKVIIEYIVSDKTEKIEISTLITK